MKSCISHELYSLFMSYASGWAAMQCNVQQSLWERWNAIDYMNGLLSLAENMRIWRAIFDWNRLFSAYLMVTQIKLKRDANQTTRCQFRYQNQNANENENEDDTLDGQKHPFASQRGIWMNASSKCNFACSRFSLFLANRMMLDWEPWCMSARYEYESKAGLNSKTKLN